MHRRHTGSGGMMDEGRGGGGAWDGELRWAIVEKVRGPLVEWRLTLRYRRKLPRRNVKGVCGGGDEGVGGCGGTRCLLRPTYTSNLKNIVKISTCHI